MQRVPCRAEQVSGDTDPQPQREHATARWRVYLQPAHDVATRDRVSIDIGCGETVLLEVTEVRRVSAPGRHHHVRLECLESTG